MLWMQWSRVLKKGLAVIGPDEARAVMMNGKALFIDARDPDEFAAGHIPGATNIPADALMTGLEPVVAGLDKTKAMILYCGNLACSKSKDLAQLGHPLGCCHVFWRKAVGSGQYTHCLSMSSGLAQRFEPSHHQ